RGVDGGRYHRSAVGSLILYGEPFVEAANAHRAGAQPAAHLTRIPLCRGVVATAVTDVDREHLLGAVGGAPKDRQMGRIAVKAATSNRCSRTGPPAVATRR